MSTAPIEAAAFSGLVDLAAERVGGKALLANDEFFAGKENLLKPGRGVFLPDEYTERGKWMDGWESRRRRTPGNDWCVIRLGLPGIIAGVDIDTNHFLGNHPPYASLDARVAPDDAAAAATGAQDAGWTRILARSPLRPGSQNLYAVTDEQRWTHLRLNIYPDGGVARLRVYGRVAPDWSRVEPGALVDLAGVQNGGVVLAASDMFFGSKENLIVPTRSESMRDGWESRRRRGPGHDWAIVQLGRPGRIRRIEIDTSHFKGNYPDRCSIDAVHAGAEPVDALTQHALPWRNVVPESKLEAHTVREFEREIVDPGECTHVRLNIFPDGGVSRMRVWGEPSPRA